MSQWLCKKERRSKKRADQKKSATKFAASFFVYLSGKASFPAD